jgi:hypothetical protein
MERGESACNSARIKLAARPETPERVVSNASLVSFRQADTGLKMLSLRGHNRGI